MSKKVLAFVGVVIMLMQFALPVFAADDVIDVSADGSVVEVAAAGKPTIALSANTEDGGLKYTITQGQWNDPTSYLVQLSLKDDEDKEPIATQTDVSAEGTIPLGAWGNDGPQAAIAGSTYYVARAKAISAQGDSEWSDWSEPARASHGSSLASSPTDVVMTAIPSNGGFAVGLTDSESGVSKFLAELYLVTGEDAEPAEDAEPVYSAQFDATGADGVYYFDIVPDADFAPEVGKWYALRVIAQSASKDDSPPSDFAWAQAVKPGDAITFKDFSKYVDGKTVATLTDLLNEFFYTAPPLESDPYGALADSTFVLSRNTAGAKAPAKNDDGKWVLDFDGATGGSVTVTAVSKLNANVTGEFTFIVGSVKAKAAEAKFELDKSTELVLKDQATFTPAGLANETIVYTLDEEKDGFDPSDYFTIENGTLKVNGSVTQEQWEGLKAGTSFKVFGTTGFNDGIKFELTIKLAEAVLTDIEVIDNQNIGVILGKDNKSVTLNIADLITVKPSGISIASLTDLNGLKVTSSDTSVATVAFKTDSKDQIVVTGVAPGKATTLKFTAKSGSKTLSTTKYLPVYVSGDLGTDKPTILLDDSATVTDLVANTRYDLEFAMPEDSDATIFNPEWSLEGTNAGAFKIIAGRELLTPIAGDYSANLKLTYAYVSGSGLNKLAPGSVASADFTKIKAVPASAVLLPADSMTLTQYDIGLANATDATTTDLKAELDSLDGVAYDYTWTTTDKDVVDIQSKEDKNNATGESEVKLIAGSKFGKKATVTVTVTSGTGDKKVTVASASIVVTTIKGVDKVEIKDASKYEPTTAKPFADKINVGKSVTFSALLNGGVKADAPKDKTVFWEVESVAPNSGYATITDKGVLKAIEPGTIRVRVTSQDAGRESEWLPLEIVQPATGITSSVGTIMLPKDGKVTPQVVLAPFKDDGSGLTAVSDSVAGIEWSIKSGGNKLAMEGNGTFKWGTPSDVPSRDTATVTAKNTYTGKSVSITIKGAASFGATRTDLGYKGFISTPSDIQLKAGKTVDLGKDVDFFPKDADATANKNLLWISDDPYVATVSASGVVKGVNHGVANITAKIYRQDTGTYGGIGTGDTGKPFELTWTVFVNKPITKVAISNGGVAVKSIEVNNLDGAVRLGTILSPEGSNPAATTAWKLTDEKVATTTDTAGEIKWVDRPDATKAATTNLTATVKDTAGTEKKATIKVTSKTYAEPGDFTRVSPEDNVVAVKKSVSLATAFASGITERGITWTSSNPSIAKVDSKGKVTGVTASSAIDPIDNDVDGTPVIITATSAGGQVVLTFQVHVLPANDTKLYAKGIALRQGNFTGIKGETYDLQAYLTSDAFYATYAKEAIEWTTSDASVVSINTANGDRTDGKFGTAVTVEVKADTGSAKITAKDIISGKSKAITIKVGNNTAPTSFTMSLPTNKLNKNVYKYKVDDASANQAVYIGRDAKFGIKIKSKGSTAMVWSAEEVKNFDGTALDTPNDVTAAMGLLQDGSINPDSTLNGKFVKVTAEIPGVTGDKSKVSQVVQVLQLVENIEITAPDQAPGASGDVDYITFERGVKSPTQVKLNVKVNDGGEAPYWNDVTVKTVKNKSQAQFSWKTSNKSVAYVDVDENGVFVKKGTKAGTATITVSALDGSKVIGTIKVSAFSDNATTAGKEHMPTGITITGPKGYENADPVYANAGKVVKLKAVLTSPEVNKTNKGHKLVSSEVIWEVKSGSDATLKNSKGTASLTLKAPGDAVTLEAYSAADPDVKAEIDVVAVTPITKVEMNQAKVTLGTNKTVRVSARVTPNNYKDYYADGFGTDYLVWSISDRDSTASGILIDNGKAGYDPITGYHYIDITTGNKEVKSVTITATNPHSGKKASFKLTVKNNYVPAKEVKLNVESGVLALGKSLKLKATVYGKDGVKATNQDVVWAALDLLNGGLSTNVSVDKNGTVKALSYEKDNMAYIIAIPVEYQNYEDPAALSELAMSGIVPWSVIEVGFPVTKLTAPKTAEVDADSTTNIYVDYLPTDATDPVMKWTSSDESVCMATGVSSIIDNGTLEVQIRGYKPGKATLTGVTTDGSNKKVSITVIVK